jgi:ectoine hydroxylase-related dioxygenase (phytanoyl-CoA dioxygenase family)
MNEEAREFFNRHGWVVINQRLNETTVNEARSSWMDMRKRCAQEMDVSMDAYRKEISQWRDLWTQGGVFLDLLDKHDQVRGVAQEGMDWLGVRLLHDHIIAKPAGKTNKKIPWHQDSMFWPVDLPGCSTWTPMEDVGIAGGCLEVIDASHLEGCEQPVDFMAEERWEFGDKAERVLLPVKAGSTILLHSLTWHRSSPNTTDFDRPVHIGLWIHPSARWRPDLVNWHPVNAHCSIESGHRLEGDMFPMWGEMEETRVPDVQIHKGTVRNGGISMFDASSILSRQVSTILQKEGTLSSLLSTSAKRREVMEKTIECGVCLKDQEEEILDILERLYICHAAYVLHKARNVFNATYAEWWRLAGETWAKVLEE